MTKDVNSTLRILDVISLNLGQYFSNVTDRITTTVTRKCHIIDELPRSFIHILYHSVWRIKSAPWNNFSCGERIRKWSTRKFFSIKLLFLRSVWLVAKQWASFNVQHPKWIVEATEMSEDIDTIFTSSMTLLWINMRVSFLWATRRWGGAPGTIKIQLAIKHYECESIWTWWEWKFWSVLFISLYKYLHNCRFIYRISQGVEAVLRLV